MLMSKVTAFSWSSCLGIFWLQRHGIKAAQLAYESAIAIIFDFIGSMDISPLLNATLHTALARYLVSFNTSNIAQIRGLEMHINKMTPPLQKFKKICFSAHPSLRFVRMVHTCGIATQQVQRLRRLVMLILGSTAVFHVPLPDCWRALASACSLGLHSTMLKHDRRMIKTTNGC